MTVRNLMVAIVLSGIGHVVHNVAEFGVGILVGPETLFPVGVTALLLVLARRGPTRGALAAMIGWSLVVIVAGGASVLPLSAWPFAPAQTVSHYAVHVVYAALQVPLLVIAAIWWREPRIREVD